MSEEGQSSIVNKGRPYRCEEPDCRVKPFSNKHDLARHRREVHRKDSEGRTPREYYCPVVHCKRHRQGFGRQWNMTQHCQKVHGSPPSQISASNVAESSERAQPKAGTGSPRTSDRDLRGKLEAELEEARLDRTKTLQGIEDQIEKLRSERDSAIQKFDEKIRALENLINVLGEGE